MSLLLPVQSQEYSIGWELWYPYQFHNKEKKLTGVDIEIFNLIANKAGMATSYVELPWPRHLMYIKTGMIDIAFGASHTKERAETAYFSVPYRKESVSFFVRKGMAHSIKLNNLAELINSKYIIGVENGYYYGKEYQKLLDVPEFRSRINSVVDLEQNAKMLLKGHIDGFLADPITMHFFIEKYKLQGEFEQHSLPIYQSDIFIMLSKKSCNESDLAKVNKAIISLQQAGKLAEIIKQRLAF
ncbi:MAG: amino acid ABC transporter substrate-binding protein [Colwellia sp.]|nr:amino acid ABC transporter substrate-binding protein [Colwellia sp.]